MTSALPTSAVPIPALPAPVLSPRPAPGVAASRPLWRSRAGRLALATSGALALVLVPAAAADAHVRVIPETTTAGGFAELTFRVPTESDTAGTVALRVELPTDTPFSSVRTTPLPGWTATVERGPLPEPVDVGGNTVSEAPLAVVWTADPGTHVGPGEYAEFSISVGPLPTAGTEVLLPATQTYSDGEVVEWAEAPLPDGEEPELPAPVLVTTADDGADASHAHGAPADGGGDASGDDAAADDSADDTGDAADVTDGATAGTATAATAAPTARDDSARWMGAGGLVLGAAALLTSLVRSRRGPGDTVASS